MSAVYGRLQGNRGEVTRGGSKASGIVAKLETWEGKVTVTLQADGRYVVEVGPKHGSGKSVHEGNVNTEARAEGDLA